MESKKIFIGSAKPGMKLASDAYDSNSRLVAPKGSVLDTEMIDRLKLYSVYSLNIIIEPEGTVTKSEEELGYYEKLHASEDFVQFEEKFCDSVEGLRNNLNDIVAKNKEVNPDEMLTGIREVISASKGHSMFDMLNCMRGYDDLTYVHSMNVALICNLVGTWLGFSQEDLDLITLGGLLHDIGKLKIPIEIIGKPGKLTDKEYQIVKSHPKLGYEILKDTDLVERIKLMALMHHERYDGGGYPMKLSGQNINEYARIVAIADVYDAMTANRVYRTGLCPFTVVAHFEKEMSIYDPKFILMFLERIANTYVSNKVLLSNGEEGKVIMINKLALSRPIVMVGSQIYDLSKEKELSIEKLL